MNLVLSLLEINSIPDNSLLEFYCSNPISSSLGVTYSHESHEISDPQIQTSIGDKNYFIKPIDPSDSFDSEIETAFGSSGLIYNKTKHELTLPTTTETALPKMLKLSFDAILQPELFFTRTVAFSLQQLFDPNNEFDQRFVYLKCLQSFCNDLGRPLALDTIIKTIEPYLLPLVFQDPYVRTAFKASTVVSEIFTRIVNSDSNLGTDTPCKRFRKIKGNTLCPSFCFYQKMDEGHATPYCYGMQVGVGAVKRAVRLIPFSPTFAHQTNLCLVTPSKIANTESDRESKKIALRNIFKDNAILEEQIASILIRAQAGHALPVDHIYSADKQFMIRPFCNRTDLYTFLSSGFKVSYQTKLSLAKQMTEALHELHQSTDRCHIDIKLANFFMHQDSSKLQIYLCDYGAALSRIQQRYPASEYFSSYPPPELLLARLQKTDLQLDTSFDMWNLGVALFHLHFPYHWKAVPSLFYKKSSYSSCLSSIQQIKKICALAHVMPARPYRTGDEVDPLANAISLLVDENPDNRPTTTTLLQLLNVNT